LFLITSVQQRTESAGERKTNQKHSPEVVREALNQINFQTQIHLTNVCENMNALSSRNDSATRAFVKLFSLICKIHQS